MNIDIFSLFPNLYDSFCQTSLIKKGQEKNIFSINLHNLFDFKIDNKRVDAPVKGHGAGMLITCPVIEKCLGLQNKENCFTIFFSPHGKKMDQSLLNLLKNKLISEKKNLRLVCARYEGIDARAEEEYADLILSVGDYVLMGGDLPCMSFLEGLLRLMPGILNNEQSILEDSFQQYFLDAPHYTDPLVWKDKKIPDVLLSGDHKKINQWEKRESIKRTLSNNVEWLKQSDIKDADKKEILDAIPNHYCALIHNDVVLGDETIGCSSVTSIDIHDIARSSETYGLKGYFIVTKVKGQQDIVQAFIDFWHTGRGLDLNKHRVQALKKVYLSQNLENVINSIKNIEGKKPLIIATSSRKDIDHKDFITYYDQNIIWNKNQPILFIFGTAHGLSKDVMDLCDYRLLPLEGLSDFNFLSVRSAAAIVFDRWLGINPKNIKTI